MQVKKFNQDWYYWKEQNSFALVWDIPEYAKIVQLPHDAMLEQAAYAESQNGGNTGYHDGAIYNYVKKLVVHENQKSEQFILKFEGIYMNAAVYVNGQLAGKNPFGYSTFYVTLNDYLKYGTENEIRVQARNGAMTNSRWYSGGGIYRDVYLLTSGSLFIEPTSIHIKTEQATKELASLSIKTKVINKENYYQDVQLITTVKTKSGEVVASTTDLFNLLSNDTRTFSQRLTVIHPELWSAETPTLYKCISQLYSNNQLIDEEVTTFGIRTLTLDSYHGLQVNHIPVKLRGACVHHDSGLLGAATYKETHLRQIAKLKAAGFNAIRMSHQPMAPAMLEACDELGMYVMDETFDMWNHCKSDYDYGLYFNEWWEKDVESMVLKDYNHPSVLLYSVGNEIPEIATNQGNKVCYELVEKIRSLDHTRYILASINGMFAVGDQLGEIIQDILPTQSADEETLDGNVNDFMTVMDTHLDEIVTHEIVGQALERVSGLLDITGYNYMTARYELDAKEHANRILVGSETYPPEIARNWEIIKKLPTVIGDFTWTGWDYLGEAGVGVPAYKWGEGGFGAAFPCQLAYVGDLDITGFRRPMSYYREIVFGLRTAPYLAIQNPYQPKEKLIKTPWIMSDTMSSWNWELPRGTLINVEVYAPGERIELWLNDTCVAQENMPEGSYRQIISIPYEPGKLCAYNYQGTKLLGQTELLTTGKATRIQLTPELMYSQELIYIEVCLVDEAGLIVMNDDCDIVATITGSADLLAFGSGESQTSD
ncbi:glycoside hydrolase family 2 TIM barrel-domain containing protein [Melissococcus plutonius]|uniref:glycoside hydrolase family 2 TIM barrel-domain containing protein n=1 Tax=Melissococcus plutonius TaxID=33970 RepID=UPI003EE42466